MDIAESRVSSILISGAGNKSAYVGGHLNSDEEGNSRRCGDYFLCPLFHCLPADRQLSLMSQDVKSSALRQGPVQLRANRVHVPSNDNSEEPFYDGASPAFLDGSYIGSRADTTKTC